MGLAGGAAAIHVKVVGLRKRRNGTEKETSARPAKGNFAEKKRSRKRSPISATTTGRNRGFLAHFSGNRGTNASAPSLYPLGRYKNQSGWEAEKRTKRAKGAQAKNKPSSELAEPKRPDLVGNTAEKKKRGRLIVQGTKRPAKKTLVCDFKSGLKIG